MTRLDRSIAIRTLVWTILLAWPLMLFGRPAYYPDSASYYQSGATIAAFIERKVTAPFQHAPAPSPAKPPTAGVTVDEQVTQSPDASDDGVKITRSISYGLFTYLLNWPGGSLLLLALAQALMTGFVIVVLLDASGVRGVLANTLWAVAVVFLTPVAVIASFAMPDIFAGLLIAIIALLAARPNRLSRPTMIALTLIAAFAISAHSSDIAIALSMAVVGIIGALLIGWRNGDRLAITRLRWGAAALLLGGLAVLISGYAGFKEFSLVPKRPPLMLARSLEDGPARWYLKEACPRKQYVICRIYRNKLPDNAGKFLWGEKGVIQRATPEQMDQIRAEEGEILWETIKRYPLEQANSALTNLMIQLGSYSLEDIRYDQIMAADPGFARHLEDRPVAHQELLPFITKATAIVALLSLLVIAFTYRRMPGSWRATVMLVLAGIVINAAVCAMLSAVANRYEARVIWLLPILAVASVAVARRPRRPRRRTASVTIAKVAVE